MQRSVRCARSPDSGLEPAPPRGYDRERHTPPSGRCRRMHGGRPRLDEPGGWLATLPATAQQRRRAFTAVALLFAAVLAIAPFATVRLPEGDGFIPAVQ